MTFNDIEYFLQHFKMFTNVDLAFQSAIFRLCSNYTLDFEGSHLSFF